MAILPITQKRKIYLNMQCYQFLFVKRFHLAKLLPTRFLTFQNTAFTPSFILKSRQLYFSFKNGFYIFIIKQLKILIFSE